MISSFDAETLTRRYIDKPYPIFYLFFGSFSDLSPPF